MKKVIVVILLIVCLFLMTSCGKKNAIEGSNMSGFFVELCSFGGNGSFTRFGYDPFTGVVYVYISGAYHSALSPYYIIENGQPVIAQYGVNWTIDEVMK